MTCPVCRHPQHHDLDQALQAENRPKTSTKPARNRARNYRKINPGSNILTNNINQICHAKKLLRKTIRLSPAQSTAGNRKPGIFLELATENRREKPRNRAKSARNYRKIHPIIKHINQQYQYNIFRAKKMLRKTPAPGPRLCRYPPPSRPNFLSRNSKLLLPSLFTSLFPFPFHFSLFTFHFSLFHFPPSI